MKVELAQSFADLPTTIQSALVQESTNPFFSGHFLRLLEQTKAVCPATGWQPMHLWIEVEGAAVFFMPLYRKEHSWGEFVFDQRWAEAYQRVGLRYYPKLVTSIPFTPSLGPRWWCRADQDEQALLAVAQKYIAECLDRGEASSWHLLFSNSPPHQSSETLLARRDTQFHWLNHGYECFDDFLQQLKSRKRKSLRREREKVREQGVHLQRKMGFELDEAAWQAFYRCYCNTYYERGMQPYLSETFFVELSQSMPESIMMVQAYQQETLIAAAIFFMDDEVLYGRHWGALRQVDCLHFEACFYQGIEFCIERGLKRFDPGTQGEHKLLRGFEPIKTDSWHMIAHGEFRDAIANYLQAETEQVERYHAAASEYLPYRQSD